MNSFVSKYLKLNRLILILALTATIFTFINSFYSNYEVQKEQLILQSIAVNRAYANKLASTTEVFLGSIQQQLAYSTSTLVDKMQDHSAIQDETNRIKYQTDTFNSVVVSSAQGVTLAASPETLNIVGRQLTSSASQKALKEKRALISPPIKSLLDNLIVVISSPIIDEKGDYLGFIGGTIYLKEFNILSKLLGEHYYKNGSYIYVIDDDKNVLYHPYVDRIGSKAGNNTGIDDILSTQEGGMVLTNSYGIDMLAGYSTIPSTGWIVVTQSPLESSLMPLTGIMQKVIIRTLPMALIVFVFIWLFARAISRPLQQLADKAKSLNSPSIDKEIHGIHSWYAESIKLKKALLTSVKLIHDQISDLRKDAETDPLTGARNRRALKIKLNHLALTETSFSILALDIDHFKRVNDTFGHPIGDKVLKKTTDIIHSFSRDNDMVARVGGEEFVLLLINTPSKDSISIAERLRIAIAETKFKTVGHITVSIGVVTWNKESAATYEEILSAADEALYEAKHNGRNQCVYKA